MTTLAAPMPIPTCAATGSPPPDDEDEGAGSWPEPPVEPSLVESPGEPLSPDPVSFGPLAFVAVVGLGSKDGVEGLVVVEVELELET